MTIDGLSLKTIWSFRFFRWRIVKAVVIAPAYDYPTYTISQITGTS